MNPFDRRAVDLEPTIAKQRAYELGRVLASERVKAKPPAWTQFLAAEYDAMRQAAGIATVAEQQKGQQAQAQQAQAQAQADQQLKAQAIAVDSKKVDVEARKVQLDAQPTPPERPKISISAKVEDPEQVTALLALDGIILPPPNPVPKTEPGDGEPKPNGKTPTPKSGLEGFQILAHDVRPKPNRFRISRDPTTGEMTGQMFADDEHMADVKMSRGTDGGLEGNVVAPAAP